MVFIFIERTNKTYHHSKSYWCDVVPGSSQWIDLRDLDIYVRIGITPFIAAAATAKSLQSCPTLCNPTDGSPPGSAIPGILQARTLEWVAISFSNSWKWKVKVKSLSCVRLFETPWTAAYQAPPSMGFSRQEYRSGVPLPSPPFIPTSTYFYLHLCDSGYLIHICSPCCLLGSDVCLSII